MRVRKVLVHYNGTTKEFDSDTEAQEFAQRLLNEEGVSAHISYEIVGIASDDFSRYVAEGG